MLQMICYFGIKRVSIFLGVTVVVKSGVIIIDLLMQLIEELFVHVHFYSMSNYILSTLVVFGIQ